METLLERSKNCIAQGALTNSKRPESFVKGVYPTHITKAKECYVWDESGKKYIDFICGLGTNILGYGHANIAGKAYLNYMTYSCPSLPTKLEVEFAEKIKSLFPFIDQIKVLKSGSEACSAAIRIARASSSKAMIYTEGYHGWHDLFVSTTPPATGVKDKFEIKRFTLTEKFLHSLEESTDAAAVILEPIITEWGVERIQMLSKLREICTKNDIILIFDEVITGFRFPKFSVANYFGIIPDLICLGKAMANGFPISVVGGGKKLMEKEYFVSSTFGGDCAAFGAAMETIDILRQNEMLENLWKKGGEFIERFNKIDPETIRLMGYPSRGVFQADILTKSLFFQESCKAGILVGPSWFFNFNHIDLINDVIYVFSKIINRIKMGEVKLEGELPSSPFAQKVRE